MSWLDRQTFSDMAGAIGILLGLYSIYSQELSDQKNAEEFEKTRNAIARGTDKTLNALERIEQLMREQREQQQREQQRKGAPQATDTWYVVDRPVALTRDRKFHSEIIAPLYRNQFVRLIKREKKWIYVEYHDPATNKKVQGWVLKKYLTRLED